MHTVTHLLQSRGTTKARESSLSVITINGMQLRIWLRDLKTFLSFKTGRYISIEVLILDQCRYQVYQFCEKLFFFSKHGLLRSLFPQNTRPLPIVKFSARFCLLSRILHRPAAWASTSSELKARARRCVGNFWFTSA